MIWGRLRRVVKRDHHVIDQAIGDDEPINRLHIEIDERAFRLLALFQPMATDLRSIVAALKINNDLEQIGDLAWIPFLALGISNALGGWASDRLIRSGLPALTARKLIMAAAAFVTVASSLTGYVQTVAMALAMMTLLMFAHGFWITNYVTLISDRFPKSAVGTVMGFAGGIGALGGILANFNTGLVVTQLGYGPLWIASGILYPLAFVVLMATVRGTRASSAE